MTVQCKDLRPDGSCYSWNYCKRQGYECTKGSKPMSEISPDLDKVISDELAHPPKDIMR